MHILWLKIGGLWPVDRGGRRRTFEILAALCRRHTVTLITTHGEHDSPRALQLALPRCRLISVPYTLPARGTAAFAWALLRSWSSVLPVDLLKCRVPAVMATATRALAENDVDVVVADFLAAFANVPKTQLPTLLFEHNVEHVIWRRLAESERRPLRRALLELEWRKMRHCERRAVGRANVTVAVSDADRSLLAGLAPSGRTAVVATGVDTRFFSRNGFAETPHRIAFCGAMDWYPNEHAVRWFLTEIWPRIRRAEPAATFCVIGRNPSDQLAAAVHSAGAELTGTVTDVRPFLGAAEAVVVPLAIGGGTRLKIFEALAMGKAVVSTTIGAEGLPLVKGRHILIADSAPAMARQVIGLLRNPKRRRALAEAGRKLVQQHFSWSQIARDFAAQVEEVCHHAR